MSRRTVLAAAVTTAAAAGMSFGLSGCVEGAPEPPAQTQPQTDPLMPVLLLQQDLVDVYSMVLEAFPELTGTLTDFQAQSSAHTEALLAAAPVAAAQIAAIESATASAPASSSVPPAPVPPADAATALTSLKQAVDESAGSLRAAALRADGDLAALLGSCAASTICHGRMLA